MHYFLGLIWTKFTLLNANSLFFMYEMFYRLLIIWMFLNLFKGVTQNESIKRSYK